MSKKLTHEKKELALALLKCGKPYREVAEALKIGIASVHRISKEPVADIEPLIHEIAQRLFSKNLLIADYILESISDFNILKASLKDKAVSSAVLTDKALLLGKVVGSQSENHRNWNKRNTPALPETGDE